MRLMVHQRGSGLIAVIVLIVVFSAMAATLNNMFQSSTTSSIEQQLGSDAFLAAEAGLKAVAIAFVDAGCPASGFTAPTGSIGGDSYTTSVTDNGDDTYEISATGTTAAGQTRTLRLSGFTCDSATGIPVAGTGGIDVDTKSVDITDTAGVEHSVPKTEISAGGGIQENGSVDALIEDDLQRPTLEEDPFPNNDESDGDENLDGDGEVLPQGNYDEVTIDLGTHDTAYLAGGPVATHIDKLTDDGKKGKLVFRPGDYYIRDMDLVGLDIIYEDPDPGDGLSDVRIFIGNDGELSLKGSNINNVTVTTQDQVSRMQIYIYPDSEFEVENGTNKMAGLIFGYGDAEIDIEANFQLTGAIQTSGEIEIKSATDFIFDPNASAALNAVAPPPPSESGGSWNEVVN